MAIRLVWPGAPRRCEFCTGGHHFFGLVDASETGFTLLTSHPTAVRETQPIGTRINFAGAGPNPSSGNTTLRFSLPAEANVQLGIHDQRGRLVRRLASAYHGDGTHAVHWNGRDGEGRNVSAGLYFGRLIVTRDAQRDVLVRKLVVMH